MLFVGTTIGGTSLPIVVALVRRSLVGGRSRAGVIPAMKLLKWWLFPMILVILVLFDRSHLGLGYQDCKILDLHYPLPTTVHTIHTLVERGSLIDYELIAE